VRLSAGLPDTVVVAVPVRGGNGAAVLVGQLPPEAEGVDVAELLDRESAKGSAGELVAVPVEVPDRYQRVLLVGTGDGSPPTCARPVPRSPVGPRTPPRWRWTCGLPT
jgi:hypothetical protein